MAGMTAFRWRSLGQGSPSDRLHVLLQCVLANLPTHLGGLFDGGAEMDAGPHPGVFDLLWNLRNTLPLAQHAEWRIDITGTHLVPEKLLEHNLGSSRGDAMSGRILRVRRCHQQGFPRLVGLYARVARDRRVADRCHRPPRVELILRLEDNNQRVGHRHIEISEQTCVVCDVKAARSRSGTGHGVHRRNLRASPVNGDSRLLVRPLRTRLGAEDFYLVEVLRERDAPWIGWSRKCE